MDRRELFKTIAGVAAASGVVGTVQVAEAGPQTVPALAVFECDGPISQSTAARISTYFETAMQDTPFKGMKAIVLDGTMRLTLLDAEGRVLNREIPNAE